MLINAVAYWEMKNLLRKNWLMIAVLAMMTVFRSGVTLWEQVPWASSISASIQVYIAITSVLALVYFYRQTGDVPYLRSRPIDAVQLWPWRLLVLTVALSWSCALLPLSQLAGRSGQVQVRGCNAIAEYEAAGLAPSFAWSDDAELYARFRAGEKMTGICEIFATTTMPGLGARLFVLEFLVAVLISTATIITETMVSRKRLELIKTPMFWVTLFPVTIGIIQALINFRSVVLADSDYMSLLYVYNNVVLIGVGLLISIAVYLAIAHRAWREMEVLG